MVKKKKTVKTRIESLEKKIVPSTHNFDKQKNVLKFPENCHLSSPHCRTTFDGYRKLRTNFLLFFFTVFKFSYRTPCTDSEYILYADSAIIIVVFL